MEPETDRIEGQQVLIDAAQSHLVREADYQEAPIDQQMKLAEAHKLSMQIGIYESNAEKCKCCDRMIPQRKFGVFENVMPMDFYKFGIDVVNYHIFTDKYVLLLICIFISYCLQFGICILLNHGFKASNDWSILNLEINYQELMEKFAIFVDSLFILVRLALCLRILFAIKRDMKKVVRQYRNLIYDHYVDESAYAMFVKNVPHLTELGILSEYLNNTYNVHVSKATSLDDLSDLAPLYEEYTALSKQKDLIQFSVNHESENPEKLVELVEKLKEKKEEIAKEYKLLVPSKTVLVTFDKMENKNLFFRKLRDGRRFDILCFCTKEQHFRGNKLYYELVNGIEHINWSNISYSLERGIKESQIKPLLCILLLSVMSLGIFLVNNFIFSINQLIIFNYDFIKIPFFKSLMSFAFNMIIGFVLTELVANLRLSNDYFKEILKNMIILHKTFINSILCYLYFYNDIVNKSEGSKQYSSFIQLIFLLAAKSIFSCLFPMSFSIIMQTFKYLQIKNKKKDKYLQVELNKTLQSYPVNVLDLFANFRLLIYSGLVLVRLYPIWGVILCILIYIAQYVFKFALYNYSMEKVYYFGYYFKLFYKIELTFLLMFVTLNSFFATLLFSGYNYIGFIILMDLNQIFQFVFSLNDFFTAKTYTETQEKFRYTFEKDNIKKYIEKEICSVEMGSIDN